MRSSILFHAEAQQEFDGNCSVQVYSVQASIPKDPAALWNAEFVQAEELFKQPSLDNCLRDNRYDDTLVLWFLLLWSEICEVVSPYCLQFFAWSVISHIVCELCFPSSSISWTNLLVQDLLTIDKIWTALFWIFSLCAPIEASVSGILWILKL